MKKFLLLLLMLTYFSGCSIQKNTESFQESADQSAGFANQSLERQREIVTKECITETDWRNFSCKNNGLFEWLIRTNEKRHFIFSTLNGTYVFNFTFFLNRKDVFYSVVTSEGFCQRGWTTVELKSWALTNDNGNNTYGYIKFDVPFSQKTKLPPVVYLSLVKGNDSTSIYDGYRGAIKASSYDAAHNSVFNFQIKEDHIEYESLIEKSCITGTDWRNFSGKNNELFQWAIRSNERRHFTFNSLNGDYIFNYTFFNDRKDVFYSIVGPGCYLQRGWTTVELNSWELINDNGNNTYGYIKFDVPFAARTKLPPVVYLSLVKGNDSTSIYEGHRGSIRSSKYDAAHNLMYQFNIQSDHVVPN